MAARQRKPARALDAGGHLGKMGDGVRRDRFTNRTRFPLKNGHNSATNLGSPHPSERG